MALTPLQRAGSNLARSMGLKGEAEKQIYSTPEWQALVKQFYPTGAISVSPEQAGAEQDVVMTALTRLAQMFNQPQRSLDLSPFQGQLDSINQALTGPMQLASLTDADLQRLAEIKAAQDAKLAEQQRELGGRLVSDLYGRGVNESSIANEAAAEFAKAMGLIQTQATSDAATRELGLRQFLTQQRQGNLALAGQNVLGAGNMAVSGFTSETDALSQAFQALIAAIGQGNQTGLARAGLNENQRQFQAGFGENQRQFDETMAAQKRDWLTNLIGMGASLATAFIPGAGPAISAGISSIFNRNKGGGGGGDPRGMDTIPGLGF